MAAVGWGGLGRISAALAFSVLVAACAGDDPATTSVPGPGTSSPGSGASTSTAPVGDIGPIDLEVVVDDSRTVEALIPVEGGELSVTAADGTVFTLTIPEDALLSATTVTMTPVRSVDGLPFGEGDSWAVQLGPEGLWFSNFATLTVTPEVRLSVDEQVFFGYEGDGTGLFLAIPDTDTSEMRIRLLHFSGYGVAKGFLGDVEAVRGRLGGSAETSIESAVAEHIASARTWGETDPLSDERYERLRQEYIEEVIAPRVAASGESCAAGRLALETVIAFERLTQLLGGEDRALADTPGLWESLDTAGRVCLEEEWELCRDQNIVHRMIPVWIAFERQAQLVGMADGVSTLAAEAYRLAERCLRFDLRIHSSGWHNKTPGAGGWWGSEVDGVVPIRLTRDMTLTGGGLLTNVRTEAGYDGPAGECSITAEPGGDYPLEIEGLEFDVRMSDLTGELGSIVDIRLLLGSTRDQGATITIQCPWDTGTGPIWEVWHSAMIVGAGESGHLVPGGTWGVLIGWDIQAGETIASLDLDWSGFQMSTSTTFELVHTPER